MALSLKIALRYLKSKKTHNAVNIISIISICGVVVTTAALVCVLSVFNGFQEVIQSRLAKLDPQIAVSPAQGKTINNADSTIEVISGVDGIEKAMPVVEDQALAIFVDYQMPVRLKGVPANYNDINAIMEKTVAKAGKRPPIYMEVIGNSKEAPDIQPNKYTFIDN